MNLRSPTLLSLGALCFATLLAGCGLSEPAYFRLNVIAIKDAGIKLPQQQDLSNSLTAMFGTPDKPVVLKETNLDEGMIAASAGPVGSDKIGAMHGLYRLHCAHCHGTSGNGNGPTAAFLNPYPRDFRKGIIKFKSTGKDVPPTTEDLLRILEQGVPGTAMPSFKLLPPNEKRALVEYVKYLSMRGKTETNLINYIKSEVPDIGSATTQGINDLLAKLTEEKQFPPFTGDKADADKEALVKSWADPISAQIERTATPAQIKDELSATLLARVRSKQKSGDEKATKAAVGATVEKLLADIRLPEDRAVLIEECLAPVVRSWTDPQIVPVAPKPDIPREESIAKGRALFFTEKVACFKCHGNTQLGDGGQLFYDGWTKDDKEATPKIIAEDLALGGLPRRVLIPRNLRQGTYRGGGAPVDIYRRIMAGIDSAQMPSNANNLTPEEAWSLVDYVLELPYEPASENPRPKSAVLPTRTAQY